MTSKELRRHRSAQPDGVQERSTTDQSFGQQEKKRKPGSPIDDGDELCAAHHKAAQHKSQSDDRRAETRQPDRPAPGIGEYPSHNQM